MNKHASYKLPILLNSYSDLDLDPMMLNIELVRAIFIYYNVFQFHVPRSISF